MMRVFAITILLFVTFIAEAQEKKKSLNEIYVDGGDVARKLAVFSYARELSEIDILIDFRVYGHLGIGFIGVKEFPTIPIGIFARTSDGVESGFCLEAGIQCVIGEINIPERTAGFNVYKQNVVDYPATVGLVYESKFFLFKMQVGYVINTAKGQNETVGVIVGFRL